MVEADAVAEGDGADDLLLGDVDNGTADTVDADERVLADSGQSFCANAVPKSSSPLEAGCDWAAA